ncbi:helix-turn-helix transcriptional regulator [Paenibacillus tritici]|uniref:Helix-turn-helix transcriptional regulator n=1 Tax=Paenibacillus tritici TaxID=1873425 RepID=A0ABX2DPF0_9BACL|nr:helix-turn-helix domain-containing protein [Paenibacillus tritici]NQX46082.1 helix-turn-helix transcriptional regulator [Paenibacillus tritici]QUL52709.1 helix-turn-helix transcriptional regulator [Paenibacillus tritici]
MTFETNEGNDATVPGHKKHNNPTEVTLEVIGGKWKTAILCLLAEQGALRNGEMLRQLTPITQKMLTQQLKELEADALILRTAYLEVPPKVVYELTDRGRTLRMVLDPLCEWGKRFV